MKFGGINVAYSLQAPNISCHGMKIAQSHEDKYGRLYVNDSTVLQRPECKEVLYPVLAVDKQSKKEARTYLTVVLDGKCKSMPGLAFLLQCFPVCGSGPKSELRASSASELRASSP